MDVYHHPALLQTACDYLRVNPGKLYVDCTFGGGSHSAEIIRRGGLVLAFDQDQDVLDPGWNNLTLVRANFNRLADIIRQYSWSPVSGILLDLGVSQHQVQTAGRGFSYRLPGPLDMRMDQELPVTAAELINKLTVHDLAGLLADYGEVPRAASIAAKIHAAAPRTTNELADVLPSSKLKRQVFQALRIALNDELGALQSVLPQAVEVLSPASRLAVISFHSLEDRLVKNFFRQQAQENLGTVVTPKPVIPSTLETSANPFSHSAKLRVFEKIL